VRAVPKRSLEDQELLREFGARVRALREAAGMSQEELAARSGLHTTYVSGIERGQRNLGLLNVHRVADGLGVPVTRLFGR
jgi:transcriptional regulator with XRE-family HTH domain